MFHFHKVWPRNWNWKCFSILKVGGGG